MLANAYSPGWKAEVNGREAELRPANFAAMGVPVTSSTRVVDFRLDRSSFWLGATISLAALAFTALLAGLGRRRHVERLGEPVGPEREVFDRDCLRSRVGTRSLVRQAPVVEALPQLARGHTAQLEGILAQQGVELAPLFGHELQVTLGTKQAVHATVSKNGSQAISSSAALYST